MKTTFSLLLLISFASPYFREPVPEEKASIFELMHHGDVLKMEIEMDLNFLLDNKNTENYQDVLLTFRDPSGEELTWNAEIRTRGRFRRRVCQFPPIKIKFNKDDLKAKDLKKHNELKLVTHCLNDEEGKENLLREYLIYKMYEKITPFHYRAQLVRIKYVNTADGSKTTHYGIILEDEKELASRLDADLCEDCFNQPAESFDLPSAHLLALYQYMVGNSDWSIPMLRNVKLLENENSGKFYAVPYDFDFSGLVNASYAIPDPTLGLKNVRERTFMGFARSNEELQPAIRYFIEKKPEVMNTIREYKMLKKSSREDIGNYVDAFYQELEQDKTVQFREPAQNR